MAGPIAEPTARKISPLFFVLAALCFLLPFVGVSCNADAAKSTLGPLISASGGGNPQQTQQVNACLDALNNYNLATYSGANLALGSAPSVNNGSGPEACKALGGSSSPTTATNADDLKLGTQPLIAVVAICILAGLILGVLRLPFRGVITALLAILAIVVLLIQYGRESAAIADKIVAASSKGGSSSIPSGIDVSTFVKTNMGIGLILCLAVLAIAALYNLVAQFLGGSGRQLAPATAGGPGGYPPSTDGYGQGQPAGYGSAPPPGGYGGAPPAPPPPRSGGYGPPPAPPNA